MIDQGYKDYREDIYNAIKKGMTVTMRLDGNFGEALECATSRVMRVVSPDGIENEENLTNDKLIELTSEIFKA